MESAVLIEDLHITRGTTRAVRGITTSIPPGTVTGLLGPSGAGKTSTMRAIVGVQKVQRGSVTVFGQSAGSAELRHAVGYMTQSKGVYPDLTVRENIDYFARLNGTGRHDVDSAIESVGLASQAHQIAATLSGGQFSRTSLACALVSRPRLLVLDEPTVGLDPVLREELWGQFRTLADSGATLIVSSHVMDEANRCDRLLLIHDGLLVADSTATELKERTRTDNLDSAFLAVVTEHMEGEAA